MYKPSEFTNINSIGVIMFGLLGDVFIRTPILKALKKIYPLTKIIAIVDPIGKQVLENNQYCDDIIVVNRDKKNKLGYQINKIKSFLQVRKKKIDLIIDLYNGGSSYFLTFTSGAKYKLGHYNSSKKNIYNIDLSDIHKIEGITTYYKDSMSVINILDQTKFSTQSIFTLLPEINLSVLKFINELKYDSSKLYLLNFGSGGEEKLLNANKYAKLVEYIYDKYQYIPLILCNPGQEYLQENFIQKYLLASKIPYVQLEKLSLQEIGSFVKNTSFLITPDTGIMHLAMAFNRYIYAVFTYTNPVLVDPKSESFISVYESFSKNELFRHQNITETKLISKIDIMFSRMQGSDI